jgi:hypothetical protein
MQLEQQAARLLYEVHEMADTFDDALSSLRREKLSLEAQIKLCEIRQLVHAQVTTGVLVWCMHVS